MKDVLKKIAQEMMNAYGSIRYGETVNVPKEGKPTSQINWPTPKPSVAPQVAKSVQTPATNSVNPQVAQSLQTPAVQPTKEAATSILGDSTQSDLTPRNPSATTYNISPDVHTAIQTAAKTYGVPASLMYDVALSESSFDPKLVNTTPDGKKAGNPTGLFQFTDSTWKYILDKYNDKPGMTLHLPNTDRTDPTTNAMAAAYLIKNGQLAKWDASEWNWGNYWTPQELEKRGYYTQSMKHAQGKRYSQIPHQEDNQNGNQNV